MSTSRHEPNSLLKQARLRRRSPSGSGRPMSRQELADTVNAHLAQPGKPSAIIDANYIGKLERGIHRWPNHLYRQAFRAVLGACCDADLGFYITRGTADATPAEDGHLKSDHPTVTSSDVSSVPAALTTGREELNGPAGTALAVTIDHDPQRAEPFLSSTVIDLGRALLSPARHGDQEDQEPVPLAELTRRVASAWKLRQRADYDALGRLLPALLGQTEASAATASGDRHRQVAGELVVHTYNAASSLLKKLGDGQLALVAADRAVAAARALNDPVLTAAALFRLANVLLASQRLDDTRIVATQASDLVDPVVLQTPRSLATWGGLLLTAAVAAARNGDESGAWELLGEARVAARMLGNDHADLCAIFGPTNVAIHGVQVAVELGDGSDALRRAERVDPDRLPTSLVERRGQLLIDLAHGHALARDDAMAVATLDRADQLAPQEVRFSHAVHRLVHTLLHRERLGAASGLRDLAERLQING